LLVLVLVHVHVNEIEIPMFEPQRNAVDARKTKKIGIGVSDSGEMSKTEWVRI